MEWKDLKEGLIYYVENEGSMYVWKHTLSNDKVFGLEMSSNYYTSDGSYHFEDEGSDINLRNATMGEKKRLNASIRANRWVEDLKENIDNYSIY